MDRGTALLGAQGGALAGLAWPGRPLWALPAAVRLGAGALGTIGAVVALAGAGALGRQLRPHPAPPAGAVLHTEGAYGWVRHPIYAGLLAGATGVAVLRRRPEPLVALAGLALVLHLKAGYEEELLRGRFGEAYETYASRVPRLVPRLSRRRTSQQAGSAS